MVWYWLFAVVVSAFLLWGVISPRGQWYVVKGWMYRNPEKNEPSNVVYFFTRGGNALLIAALLAVGVLLTLAGVGTEAP